MVCCSGQFQDNGPRRNSSGGCGLEGGVHIGVRRNGIMFLKEQNGDKYNHALMQVRYVNIVNAQCYGSQKWGDLVFNFPNNNNNDQC